MVSNGFRTTYYNKSAPAVAYPPKICCSFNWQKRKRSFLFSKKNQITQWAKVNNNKCT